MYGICSVYGYVYVIVCGVCVWCENVAVCVWYVSMAACVVECVCGCLWCLRMEVVLTSQTQQVLGGSDVNPFVARLWGGSGEGKGSETLRRIHTAGL